MSVLSVSLSPTHTFTKSPVPSITLIPDLGILGDSHNGPTVQHRSRLTIRPKPKNLRQCHLISVEGLAERSLDAGDIGENITTKDLDLLEMSTGTKLHFVDSPDCDSSTTPGPDIEGPVVMLTGLRNPCPQIEKFRSGLQETFIVRDEERRIVGRKAGVMSVIVRGGEVSAGMRILVEEPEVFVALAPV